MDTAKTVVAAKLEMVVDDDMRQYGSRKLIKQPGACPNRRTGLAQMEHVEAAIEEPAYQGCLIGNEIGGCYDNVTHWERKQKRSIKIR